MNFTEYLRVIEVVKGFASITEPLVSSVSTLDRHLTWSRAI